MILTSSGTADANGPATLVVRSFSNNEPRTVELAKEADTPVVLSFKNPEAYIFEPLVVMLCLLEVVLVELLVLIIVVIMGVDDARFTM